MIFTTDPVKENKALNDMREWLYKSNYPKQVVARGLHNAKLQGPAPPPSMKKDVVPFVTTHCSNYATNSIIKKANMLLENCPDDSTRNFFSDKKVIQALRQPPNILRQVTSAKYTRCTNPIPIQPNGVFACLDPRCKIHNLYLVQCSTFTLANGTIWKVPTHITCNSKKVIYFLKCNTCDWFSYLGKTNILRKRTNNHISCGKSGKGKNRADKHFFVCNKDHQEPLFQLYVLMELNDYDKLRVYEDDFHKRGFDTCNSYKASAST